MLPNVKDMLADSAGSFQYWFSDFRFHGENSLTRSLPDLLAFACPTAVDESSPWAEKDDKMFWGQCDKFLLPPTTHMKRLDLLATGVR
jgi:hypothetical protein